ncbi:MAG: Hsp33 family molecular chaperone HslO [Erysipelotrichaceae bacterium]|nr:Hsp33 family molecular chaperone HslO [Erysipelotrichaceae bacterium]
MKDEIVIAEALDGQVRIHAACTTKLVQEAVEKHHCMATSAAALGRTLTVTGIMASDLKSDKEKITSIFNGHGPAGTVMAQADGAGNVRGFIGDPNLYMTRKDGHLAVGRAIGTNGTLTVTKDLGLKEPYSGSVAIQSGEVGDDFAYYFALSEQTPSVVGVGVLVNPDGTIQASGGLIYQLLPHASEEAISYCEKTASSQKPVSELINETDNLEDMIHMYFPDAVILEHKDIRWHCSCSKEKFRVSLSTLKKEDLQEMIDDDKGAEIVCQFCNSRFFFDTDELKEILKDKENVENRQR